MSFVAGMLWGCEGQFPDQASAGYPDTVDPGYIVLDESLEQLKHDFNAQQGKVRLLFIVGDTCGISLHGMADLNDAFLARAQADERLATLVVHVPTMGAEEKHVAGAIPLMQGPRIKHYWDEAGDSGGYVGEALNLGGIYAWDVWLAYGPEAQWSGTVPPAPDFWMHQFGLLNEDLRLDADRFGAMTIALMQEVSAKPLVESQSSVAQSSADGTVISSVAQPRGRAIGTHIRGVGGYENLKSIQTMHREGEIAMAVGTASLEVIADRDHGLQRKYANPGYALPANIELALTASWEMDGLLVDWKDKGHQVRISGMRKVGSSLAWKLFVRRSSGERWALYVDSHSGDVVLHELLDEEGEVRVSIRAMDFEEVDGIRLPGSFEIRNARQELLATEHFRETHILR